MLLSSHFLAIETLITPLLLCLALLVCKNIYHFEEYTPIRNFNNFVHSAVNARREGDENPTSSAVAETLILLANSSYGYQIMDRSRHRVTKYFGDEKTHESINNKSFKNLGCINDQSYEVKLVKSENEHTELLVVGYLSPVNWKTEKSRASLQLF